MGPRRRSLTAILGVFALAAGVVTAPPAAAAIPAGPGLLINEVYGAGGNTGAVFNRDFIELFNSGTVPVDVDGWSVQYASATGSTWTNSTNLSGTIPPGTSYLIGQASGANGAALPAPDVSGIIAMAGGAGKVALVNTTAALTCGTDCDGNPAVVDFVGFGTTANDFAGTGPTPAPSATNSVSRNDSHTNTANNAADFTAGAPTPAACGAACVEAPNPVVERTIAEIQGTDAGSPLAGDTVITKGIVTAVYPAGGFRGYYLQTAGTGGARDLTKASDGVFVFQPTGDLPATVVIGNYLQVTGAVSEFNGLTELTVDSADVADLDESTVAPVTAATTSSWPSTDAERESLEGMLYRPTGDYTVSNTFTTNQFGEVGLAFGTTPLIQRTEVELPGPVAGSAVEADNNARKVALDDGSSINFLATGTAAQCGTRPVGCLLNGSLTPPYVSPTNPVIVGAAATFTSDVVVDFRNNAWKFQPTAPVIGPGNAGAPATFANTRTTAPDEALINKTGSAGLKVASFNVLNYFTTLGTDSATCTAFYDRDDNGSTVNSGCNQRGAWDSADFAKQQTKIVAAINALDADVVGLMEIENSAALGEQPDEALNSLVAALNAAAGSTVWAANPSSAELPPAAELDVINSAIIYKPAAVSRVGEARALGTASGPLQAFDNAREPLGQVFAPVGGGEPFLFVVNHFKSKGSAGPHPGDADSGDGQGASQVSRELQAAALRDWIPTVQGNAQAVVLAGDFNSYAMEDPLRILYDAGYTNVEQHFANKEYSYSFSGLSGSLDHILVNDAALGRATGTDIWNINSGESLALEYSRWNYHGTDFHDPGPYRSSDHDPVVLGLLANNAPETVQILGINDFHGRIRANGVEAGAAVLAGAVDQLRATHPNTVFAAAGDLIGASTFESFIAHDKPTIDALNSAGLEVSAVGNHEFDQGYDDLLNRVMAPYDATTNPYGGAEWKYIGANVHKPGADKLLEPTFVREFNGVKVGFVGAVTEHLDELVSPAGIEGVVIEDIVTATNREADALKASGVDIVVLLVHEGAATTAVEAATDPASDFGKIVTGVNTNVDAIVSGHTHLAYNHAIPVQQWIDEGRQVTVRPVVSAGQYGYNLNQLLFQVDSTGKVVGLQQNLLPLTGNYPAKAETQAIVDAAVAEATVLGGVKIGTLGGPFNRAKLANGTTENRGGESTLGNLVAEVQQTMTQDPTFGGAQIAFMNPGGMRADMVGNNAAGYPADLTFKQAADVQPFANTLVNMTLTGAQLKSVLEEQWQPAGAQRPFLRLGVSEGFTYTYDPAAAAGSRITGMWLDGVAIEPAVTFSVTANSFLASGGDNFTTFASGTGKRDTGRVDLQAMVDYLGATTAPVMPDYTQRSVGVTFPAGSPAAYAPGDTLAFAVSSLAFSSVADTKDAQVEVKLGDTVVGTFAVDNTIGTEVFDEYGKTAVSFAVPAGTPVGPAVVTVRGVTTGTVAVIPVTIEAGTVASSVSLTVSGPSQKYGTPEPETLVATVVLANGAAASGTVTFMAGNTELGSAPVVDGKAQLTIPATTPAGSLSIVATFVPSDPAAVVGSSSSAVAFVVEKAVSVTTLTVTLEKVKGTKGKPVSKYDYVMSAGVTLDSGAVATGAVRFSVDGVVVGEAGLANGVAGLKVPAAKGNHTVVATYLPPDTVNYVGSSAQVAVQVK